MENPPKGSNSTCPGHELLGSSLGDQVGERLPIDDLLLDACSLLGLSNDPEHLVVRASRQLPAPIDTVETPPARILDCHPSLAEQRPNLRVGDPHIRSSLSSQPVWHGHALVPPWADSRLSTRTRGRKEVPRLPALADSLGL